MGSPKFMGLTGRPLSLAVSTVATTGFLLFGYDQVGEIQNVGILWRFLCYVLIPLSKGM
jgi:hypothetical protein